MISAKQEKAGGFTPKEPKHVKPMTEWILHPSGLYQCMSFVRESEPPVFQVLRDMFKGASDQRLGIFVLLKRNYFGNVEHRDNIEYLDKNQNACDPRKDTIATKGKRISSGFAYVRYHGRDYIVLSTCR